MRATSQITWNDTKATVYDASSNTAYTFDLPASSTSATKDNGTAPSVDEITSFLTDAAKHWTISGAQPSNVAGEEAYTVTVSPSHDGGLLGSARARVGRAERRSAAGRRLRAGRVVAGARAEGRPTSRSARCPTATSRSRRPPGPRSSTSRRRRGTGSTDGARRAGDRPCRGAGGRAASPSPRPTRSSACRGRTSGSSARATRAPRSSSTGRASGAIVVVERQQDASVRRRAERPAEPAGRLARRASPGTSLRRSSGRSSPGIAAACRTCSPARSRPARQRRPRASLK